MLYIDWINESTLTAVFLLVVAFILSAVIGFERQRKLKSAGLRTHTLVGVGAALFTLVSAYGFSAVLGTHVALDPSRIAAQIVSGIGFLGAGVIFVKQNAVTGLTTAASIWVTAAVGMACGAGMPVLAAVATVLQLCAVWLLGYVGRMIRSSEHESVIIVRYRQGQGALRSMLAFAAEQGFEVLVTGSKSIEKPGKAVKVEAQLRLRNHRKEASELLEEFSDVPGVVGVRIEAQDND